MQQLQHKETDQAIILGFSGEIIMDVVADMKAEIEQLADCSPRKPVILDLGAVTFMDSSGVGLLIGLRRMCLEQGKTLTVTNPSPPIKKLLDMLRLTEYFSVQPTSADAPSA